MKEAYETMIQTIIGHQGSGKTIKLIQLANEALSTETGNVFFIDNNNRHMYDLQREIRFVNAKDYDIKSLNGFYGLLCGMLAANFDITLIVIDGFMKTVNVTNDTMDEMETFFQRVETLSEKNGVRIVFGISGESDQMPEFITRYAQ